MDDQRGWWDRIPDCCRGGFHSAEKERLALSILLLQKSAYEKIVSPALVQITVIYFSCLEMGKWLETN
jgi:hypothetical protein